MYQTSSARDWFSQVRTWAGRVCKASKVLRTDLTTSPGLWDEHALVIIVSNFFQLSWLGSLSSPQSDTVPCTDSSRSQSYGARTEWRKEEMLWEVKGKKTDFSSFPRDENRCRTGDNCAWTMSISHNCHTRLHFHFDDLSRQTHSVTVTTSLLSTKYCRLYFLRSPK